MASSSGSASRRRSSPDQTRRFDVVNAVAQKEARKREGRAAFIDTYTMFAGDDGGYTEYLADGSGRLKKVRAGDGVHFEREGGDMIAREVLKAAEPRLRPDELAQEEHRLRRLQPPRASPATFVCGP